MGFFMLNMVIDDDNTSSSGSEIDAYGAPSSEKQVNVYVH